jgi:hypothetical protein
LIADAAAVGASKVVPTPNPTTALLLAKIVEQIDGLRRLIAVVPTDHLEWRPAPATLRLCEVLGHLLECLAGFCATLHALYPEALANFSALRGLPVNHCCGVQEASARIDEYRRHIERGFEVLTDRDLTRDVPTVFVHEGQAGLTLLLGNLEHLLNHKYQLFFYLKLLGVSVGTKDLYRLGTQS